MQNKDHIEQKKCEGLSRIQLKYGLIITKKNSQNIHVHLTVNNCS
jgi:hypothetical protein